MKFKIFLLSCLLVLCASFLKAQNSNMNPTATNPLNTYLNNFVQAPPNAASLGKYADYPVGYYTGVPNISVPIYTIKDGSITLPISLSYHASGIRVSETASWVGLGWALNATGVINRTVRGAPDEGSRKSSYAPSGYYKDHGLLNVAPMNYPVAPDSHQSDSQGLFYRTMVDGILTGGSDTEPDLFTFNFDGHTGKFVFDENGQVRLLEDDNLRINVHYNTANQNFDWWVITTEDGIQYYFGENNATEMVRPRGNQIEDANDQVPANWYLTRIVNPNTKETATFYYTAEAYDYRDLGPESKLFGGSNGVQTDVSYTADNSTINGDMVVNPLTTAVQGLRLTSIVTNNYTVKFAANTLRLDLNPFDQGWKNPNGTFQTNPAPVYSAPNSLDSIKVYTNQNNACIRQFALAHGYFSSLPAGTATCVTNSFPGELYDTQRLKLLSVTEISGDGSISKPPYIFSYQESFQLPRRLSYDQDHWGFSNNSAGNANTYFTPPVFTGFSHYSGGANRHPKWPDMSAFTLTNIKDPLGVKTTFTYGANSANNGIDVDVNPQVADTLVGGLRIERITVTDSLTGKTQIRSFSYKTPDGTQPGGNLTHIPVYLIQLENEYFQDTGNPDINTKPVGYIGPYKSSVDVQILKQSQSIVPMQDANGNHIVYPHVKEVFGASGVGGYKTYTFASTDPTAPATNSKLDMSVYSTYEAMSFPPLGTFSGYWGNGHLNDTTSDTDMLPVNLAQHYAGYSSWSDYPYAPTQVDIVSGKLIEEDTYDANNNLLESISNIYGTQYHENFWIRGLKAYVQNLISIYYKEVPSGPGGQDVLTPFYDQPSAYNALTFYKLHTGISHLTSTTKKTFTGSNFVAVTSKYGYESPYHTLKTSDTTTDSQGNTLITKTYYSPDYANTATSDNIFGKMKARHIIEPVRTDNWKNGNLVGERVTAFQDFAAAAPDTLIYPASIYNLETTQPLTPTQIGESMTWSTVNTLIPSSTYLISKVGFSYDGTTGKMTNQQLSFDKSQGIQWSSQLKLPVALVDNAQSTPTFKQFYYEGFEESTLSNLWIGTGHTGTKCVFAPYTVSWTPPSDGRVYKISYWYYTGGTWKLQPEQTYAGSLALSGGTAYDDIRIYPVDANMVTYTYDQASNLTSTIDPKGLTTYYEYDAFQRLMNIRDKDKNIVKSFCYNYASQANGCYITRPSYTNDAENGTFQKNNCGSGYMGTYVTYYVPGGIYTGTSAQDADNQAMADINANGQNYANNNGTCIATVNIALTNNTNDSFQVSFTGGPISLSTFNMPANSSTTIAAPIGTYYVNITENGQNLHTITMTNQTTPPPAPRANFSGVNITTSSSITILIY